MDIQEPSLSNPITRLYTMLLVLIYLHCKQSDTMSITNRKQTQRMSLRLPIGKISDITTIIGFLGI